MKKEILVIGLVAILAACAPTTKQAQDDLQKPINCATAEGDIRVLKSEKKHVGAEIAAGITAIVPIGLVVHAAKGEEGQTMKVATGKYNKMIDARIAEIKEKCGVE